MRFKYQSNLDELPNCPPSSYESKEITAFRFVFEKDHPKYENSFLPVLIQQPNRMNSLTDQGKCEGYGLSLFDTQENAINRYIQIIKQFGNFYEIAGKYIAEGLIEESDGVVSEVNEIGHFTLHESEQCDLQSEFKIVFKVYNDGRA